MAKRNVLYDSDSKDLDLPVENEIIGDKSMISHNKTYVICNIRAIFD